MDVGALGVRAGGVGVEAALKSRRDTSGVLRVIATLTKFVLAHTESEVDRKQNLGENGKFQYRKMNLK